MNKNTALGITLDEIFQALQVKNLPADAGRIKIGSEYMPIYPSGVFKTEKDFGDRLISSQGGLLIYLKNVATIHSVILVSVDEYEIIDQVFQKVQSDLEEMFPDGTINVKKFNLGPGNGGKIQLRINGPDPVELRRMADETKAIITADPDSKAIRDEWGPKVKTGRPILAEDRARRAGIDRRMASAALQSNYTGTLAGVHCDGIELIPIYARAPAIDRETVEDMADISIITPITREKIPLLQDGFFVAMAVTIMFGLGFATVLTLVLVPVLYATFFKIPYRDISA